MSMRFRDQRNGTLEFGGLSIPVVAFDFATRAVGLRRSTVCVVRHKGREVRRYNAWRPGDDLDVVPPVQDALQVLPLTSDPVPTISVWRGVFDRIESTITKAVMLPGRRRPLDECVARKPSTRPSA
jgi:hypothetical protein